jgi:ATP-dependent Clp protease adaptor protein ClpS
MDNRKKITPLSGQPSIRYRKEYYLIVWNDNYNHISDVVFYMYQCSDLAWEQCIMIAHIIHINGFTMLGSSSRYTDIKKKYDHLNRHGINVSMGMISVDPQCN